MVSVNVGGRLINLARIPSPEDARDRAYSMAALLGEPSTRQYRNWTPGRVLNQADTPHCVGFAWAQWEQTSPVRLPNVPDATADGILRGHHIYEQCKLVDGYSGDGTYVRTGAEVERGEKRLDTYVWAWNVDTLIDWVLENGPVVVGTNWTQSMFYPSATGLITVSGPVIGGHAWMIYGANKTRKLLTFMNSWGPHWGRNGRGRISFNDMQRLIEAGGEVVTAVELPRVP